MKSKLLIILLFLMSIRGFASFILIPMDDSQKNHLKAYGLAYWALKANWRFTGF
jgi:hypothetical protein